MVQYRDAAKLFAHIESQCEVAFRLFSQESDRNARRTLRDRFIKLEIAAHEANMLRVRTLALITS